MTRDPLPNLYRRTPGLNVEPVPDGYVVYDDARAMVHYLNPSAAIVLELCGICRDGAEIARRMQAMFDLSAPPAAEVDECLARLLDQGIVHRADIGR